MICNEQRDLALCLRRDAEVVGFGWHDVRLWSTEEVALLATLPDAEVAGLTGCTPNPVAKDT